MTTDIELLLDATPTPSVDAALAEVEAFFMSVEQRFSRFLEDSELSVLNRSENAGRPVPVSPELARLVQLAVAAARRSDGVFDPTVIAALEAAGYDRSIDLIRAQGAAFPRPLAADDRPGRWREIQVRQDARGSWLVLRPEGQRLDLGGIAKGWAADRGAGMLRPLGPGVVNAGGDMRAWGDQPGADTGTGWLAAVDHPLTAGVDVAWLHVRDGAVATSSVVTRRWAGGHHLIDPRTGSPADTNLLSVTALAPTAAEAEVAAKVVLVLGRVPGLEWLAGEADVEALLAGADGQFYGTPGISRWLVA
ncbi:MAG TPA: FAD:protein FMN transferase [Anaerolineae bacterium]